MTEDLIRDENNLAADAENVLVVKDVSRSVADADADMTLRHVLSSDDSIWDVDAEGILVVKDVSFIESQSDADADADADADEESDPPVTDGASGTGG